MAIRLISSIGSPLRELFGCATGPWPKVPQGQLTFIKGTLSRYYNSYVHEIMEGDADEYGAPYINITSFHMDRIEKAALNLDMNDLMHLKNKACTKYVIENNPQYFAFNHIRSISVITVGLILAENMDKVGRAKALTQYLFPMFIACAEEEAVCLRTNLAKVFVLLFDFFPREMSIFLDSRKKYPRLKYTEEGVINYIFKKRYELLNSDFNLVHNREAKKIIRKYGESKAEKDTHLL